jgi:hypothetical protein
MSLFKIEDTVVEAMQFTNASKDQVFNFVTCNRFPDYEDDDVTPALTIQTAEGSFKVSFGDWVIKDIKDHFYSCKADTFESMYKEVENNV